MKIKEVKKVSDWSKNGNTIYFHNLEMENGDKINIGVKNKLNVGDDLDYILTGEDDGQQEFKKAKRKPKEFNPSKPSNNASFALSYAKDVYIAKTIVTEEDMFLLADKMLNWLNSK